VRIWLKHETPDWVDYPEFFITICTRPRHLNQLCLPERSDFILLSAEKYHHLHRWHCSLILLMPDHLHALIQIPERYKLTHVIASWKGYLARDLNILWHRGFFDHRIRRSESLNEKWNYIVMNPVRAGFVSQPEHWPHRWSPEGTDDLGRAGRSSLPSFQL
jgi:REP element-mobilizing transposase RayT